MPTGKRRPGWTNTYQKARRDADAWLREKYRDEWQAKFDELRAGQQDN